jgi:hypothetical protein
MYFHKGKSLSEWSRCKSQAVGHAMSARTTFDSTEKNPRLLREDNHKVIGWPPTLSPIQLGREIHESAHSKMILTRSFSPHDVAAARDQENA